MTLTTFFTVIIAAGICAAIDALLGIHLENNRLKTVGHLIHVIVYMLAGAVIVASSIGTPRL